MLKDSQRLALFMEGALGEPLGKMGYGVLRFSRNPIACIIDSTKAGLDHLPFTQIDRPCPVVGTVAEAKALGADVFVLGIANTGGVVPPEWLPWIDEAVASGLNVINGLHDLLGPRYTQLSSRQWVWDVRVEPPGLSVGTGLARELPNRRVLMIGTDMAIGKMTAGLEIHKSALSSGIKAAFIATGQIGITIMGSGVPLDAVRLDFASGAIEREVMKAADAKLVVVEGQGALIHPGSTANLPLLRGSCPTHLILCHRAGQTHLRKLPWVRIPPLNEYLELYEDLATACGIFPRPMTVGVALNTSHLDADESVKAVSELENELGKPCSDVVREGGSKLFEAVMA